MKKIIHIGAEKTATTTLQKGVFQGHPKIKYYGINGEYKEDNYNLNESVFVFSDETLTDPVKTKRGVYNILSDLHSFLPDSHILLTIRSQYTALGSFYCHTGVYHYKTFKGCLTKRDFTSFDYNKIIQEVLKFWDKSRVHILVFVELKTNLNKYSNKLSSILGIDRKSVV